MARIIQTNRVPESVFNTSEGYMGNSPTMDLRYGGQNGFMPRVGLKIGDKHYAEIIANSAYVSMNVIGLLLSEPKFLHFMPNSEKWIGSFKALMELHPISIEGLNSGLTVETDTHPIGGSGAVQEEATNVTRATSDLTFTFKEKAGKSIQKFLDYIIRYGIQDPDTKKANIGSYLKSIDDVGGMYTPDFYTCTMIFIEPDRLHKTVVDAWLCINMFPKSNGERTGKRNLTEGGSLLDLSINFTSITINNTAVIALAERLLSELTVLNGVPDLGFVLPTVNIDNSVREVGFGYNSYQNDVNAPGADKLPAKDSTTGRVWMTEDGTIEKMPTSPGTGLTTAGELQRQNANIQNSFKK